jgi:hydrogenase small subunit
VNAVNLAASLVYFLANDALPPTDSARRPRFAYSQEIHDHCEREIYEDRDMYVRAWGDEGHRKGWCLKLMGCKGPETHSNCYREKWNDATSWPIGAGHGCIGCTNPNFWDRMTPFYARSHDD